MDKKQLVECKLEACSREFCGISCCNKLSIEEWVNEYYAFHDRMRDYLISKGIEIEFRDDRVVYKNCSDNNECKFLEYSLNSDIDPRPVDCKIFPYNLDWKSIDFENKTVRLYFLEDSCPLIKTGNISEAFRKEVETVLKRDLATLFYGTDFKIKFP